MCQPCREAGTHVTCTKIVQQSAVSPLCPMTNPNIRMQECTAVCKLQDRPYTRGNRLSLQIVHASEREAERTALKTPHRMISMLSLVR
jgi:hypothetical protein